MLRPKPIRRVPPKPKTRRPELDDLEKTQKELRQKEQEIKSRIGNPSTKKEGKSQAWRSVKKDTNTYQLNVEGALDTRIRLPEPEPPRTPLSRNRRRESRYGLFQFMLLIAILLFFLVLLLRVLPS